LTFYSALPANTTQPVVEITKEPGATGDETEITLTPWTLDLTKIKAGDVTTKLDGVSFSIKVEIDSITYYSQTSLITAGGGKITIPNIIGVGQSNNIKITIHENAPLPGYSSVSDIVINLKRDANGVVSAVGTLPAGVVLQGTTINLLVQNEPVLRRVSSKTNKSR